MAGKKKSTFFANNSQLLIPLIAIALLVIFNLFRDPSFFSVSIASNNRGDPVLQGNLISILNGASELCRIGRAGYLRRCAGGDRRQYVCEGPEERHRNAGPHHRRISGLLCRRHGFRCF